MNPHDALMGTAVLLGGVNLVVLVTLAFRWGRWSGIVDTKLGHYDERFDRIEAQLKPGGVA